MVAYLLALWGKLLGKKWDIAQKSIGNHLYLCLIYYMRVTKLWYCKDSILVLFMGTKDSYFISNIEQFTYFGHPLGSMSAFTQVLHHLRMCCYCFGWVLGVESRVWKSNCVKLIIALYNLIAPLRARPFLYLGSVFITFLRWKILLLSSVALLLILSYPGLY